MKFRFSIRHLLIAVALFAVLFGWVAYQLNWIRERHNLLVKIGYNLDPSATYPPPRDELLPWSLKLFGEQPVVGATIRIDVSDNMEYAKELFPEATFEFRPKREFSNYDFLRL